jgi:hypothetical protein
MHARNENLFTSGLYKDLALEIALCAGFCPPGVDFYVSGRLNDGFYFYRSVSSQQHPRLL